MPPEQEMVACMSNPTFFFLTNQYKHIESITVELCYSEEAANKLCSIVRRREAE